MATYKPKRRTTEGTEDIKIPSMSIAGIDKYQTKTDESLDTESKEIAGAINEVNTRLDNGVGLEIVTTAGSSTAYTATVISIKSLTAGVGFIMKPHVTNTSTSATLNVNSLGAIQIRRRLASNPSYYYEVNASMLKVGKAYHVIYDGNAWVLVDFPKVAPSDLSATVPIEKGGTGATTAEAALTNLGAQAASDDTLETTDKTVAGAINELNGKTIDKVAVLDTWYEGQPSNTNTHALGIEWTERFAFYDGAYNEISTGEIYHNVPIVAGKNVTFDLDQENQVVKINAEGGSTMPQIRFTGAICKTLQDNISTTNPLKLTVEIVGGGSLQVGDALQICERKSYTNYVKDIDGIVVSAKRKKKLRRFAEYTITADDLDKRFITLTLDGTGKNEPHAYYHNSRCDGVFLSPLYLRIRRPKGVLNTDDSGMTSEAEFSNIVTIWKSYFGEGGVAIQ